MKDPIDTMLSEIVTAYQKLPGCRAMALIGSRARGTSKSFSDVDLMMVYFSPATGHDRKVVIESLQDKGSRSETLEYPMMMDVFQRGGLPVKVWHVSQDMICERVATIEKRLRLISPMLIASLFESKIFLDPRNQLQIWKSRIQPVPDGYKQTIIPQIFAEVVNVIEDLNSELDSQNHFYIQHELLGALENIYELIFLVNGQYLNLSHRIDSLISGFSLLPKGFMKSSEELLSAPCTRQGLRQKWRILSELAKISGEFLRSKGFTLVTPSLLRLNAAAPFLFKKSVASETEKFKSSKSAGSKTKS